MRVAQHAVLLCGFAATTLGLGYMAAGGAPLSYLLMNGAAFAIGVVIVVILSQRSWRVSAGAVCLGLAVVLLTSFLLGTTVNGATRWLRFGNIIIQPSLILLPVLVLTFATARNWTGAIGVTLTAIVLALQPDRAMSGGLAAGALILAFMRPDPRTLSAAAAALTGFATAMLRPDTQGAMPFVDGILLTSFDVHPAAGVAVISGSLISLMPAVIGLRKAPPTALGHAVFGAVWAALVIAAALGNYPTPLVGYGGSAILGYLLCSIALRSQASALRFGRDSAATQERLEERREHSMEPV
ncbi:FtsW/RodA/SpoVE family cell cycle protein [Sphingomonas arenae]|uniref:FtsW/RodA/SpoVE family cell cycle protein n=1 Tax=Sphingomonas arenae TaxID=2812555 RepID=UPI0019681F67|nr:FtsW/RodA/SpoVE family cell cycle protein [Sphingomonas arenae]